jgi:hypothetical protein
MNLENLNKDQLNRLNKLCYGIKFSYNDLQKDSLSYSCRTQFLAFLRLCTDTTGLFSKFDCKSINAENVMYSEIIVTLSKAIYGLFFSNIVKHNQVLHPGVLVEEKRFFIFSNVYN